MIKPGFNKWDSSQRVWIVVALFLCLIPFIIMVAQIISYHVDLPFWDQWHFVPILEKSYESGVEINVLWTQHNEHRLLFPRAIMLLLARSSGYNILWELILIIILCLSIFILIITRFLLLRRVSGHQGFPWVIPIIALLSFSLKQGINLVWGWQIQIFLNLLAVAFGVLFLTRSDRNLLDIVFAILFGVIATYSFANGLLFWIVGLVIITIPIVTRGTINRRHLTVWLVSTILIYITYFYKYSLSSSPTESFYFLKHPIEYFIYTLKYLGAPITHYETLAVLAGLAGLAFFVYSFFRIFKKGRKPAPGYLFFLAMGLYAVMSSLMSGIGRLEFGTSQAMSFRYVTISSFLWIANLVYIGIHSARIRNSRILSHFKKPVIIITIIMVIFTTSLLHASYRVGHSVLRTYHETLHPVRQKLKTGITISDEELSEIYVYTHHVRSCLDLLRERRLSLFREE